MRKILLAIGMVVALAGQALAYPRYYQEPDRYPARNPEAYDLGAPNDVVFRVGVFGDLGYSNYTMGDENQFIDQLNATSSLEGGHSLSHINGGLTGGLGMTFGMSDFCQIGFEYEGLGGQTSGSLSPAASGTLNPTDANIMVPASEFGGFIKLLMPLGNRWLLSFGGGLYNLWIDGDTEKYTFADGSGSANTFYGSTLATKLWVGGEYFFTRHLSLGVDAGYRFAKINDVTDANGTPFLNSDGSNFTLDYSGPYSRAALQFYF